jgi:hypothetical protein
MDVITAYDVASAVILRVDVLALRTTTDGGTIITIRSIVGIDNGAHVIVVCARIRGRICRAVLGR